MAASQVLIVGGGIGGLTAALALGRRGISYRVIERAPELKPVGAGITLSAGAVAVLSELGVDLSQVGREIRRMELQRADGSAISSTVMDNLRERVGPTYALHRHELHQALSAGLSPGALRLGETVHNVRQMGDGLEVEFSDGRHERFALVLGADGINSQVRRTRWPEVEVRYSGYTCWRTVVNVRGPEHPIELWGKGRRLGVVPLTGDRTYVFATLNTAANQPEEVAGRVTRLRELFRDFRWAEEMFSAASDDQIIRGDINEVLATRWTDGRLGLLGDAAHASTPNMGMGATLAIEDAWVLAEELSARGLTTEALSAYEERRYARAESILVNSRRLGQLAQWENGAARGVRDFLLGKVPLERAADEVLKATLGEPAVRTLVEAQRLLKPR